MRHRTSALFAAAVLTLPAFSAFADDHLSLAPTGEELLALFTPQPANPQRAYLPLPADEDWHFLQHPTDHDLFDPIKYIPVGTPDLTLSFGGSERLRYEDKINPAFGATSPTARTKDDDYFLERTYLHMDLRYLNYFRIYAEGVSTNLASSTRNPPPTPFPTDTADLHQGFIDISPFDYARDGFGMTLRLGRQELLFDRQKLIGPLDWANTRRTWDGGAALFQWEKFQAEMFWVRPVLVSPYTFDEPDDHTNFAGLYLTHPFVDDKNHFSLFGYYLNSANRTLAAFKSGATNFNPDGKAGNSDRVTLGGRVWGKLPANFDYDAEGGPQLGQLAGNDILAGYFSGEMGYTLADVFAKPRLSVGYDYASGDHARDGQSNTFNQLFPTGHLYMGYLDFVGRQNIHAANVTLTVTPTPELKVWASWHYFALADAHDALYNAAGAALRYNAAGADGTDVGDEFDVTGTYQLGRHTTFTLGYGAFFPGEFIQKTGKAEIAQMVYTSVEFKF